MNGILGNGLREAKRWWVEYRRENYFRFFFFFFLSLSLLSVSLIKSSTI